MHYDYLIVGSGLAGASIARLLANAGRSVLVIEKRKELGGNIATYVENGIIVHEYGPHIYHTSNEEAWDFVNKYSEMYPFINSPLANYEGHIYHMPFNMNTFHELWGVDTPEQAQAIIREEVEKEHIAEPRNLEEQALKLVGRTIYEALIKGYTEKQWGRPCKELPAFIIKRLPLRYEYDNNYFNDKYQGLPKGGFSVLIDNLLAGIDRKLNCDYFEHRNELNDMADSVIYTGPIDAYFSYSLGHLDYRSLRFETKELNVPDFQGNAVVNYTSSTVPYTRVTEHKHFDPFCKNQRTTIVSYEYPDKFEDGKIPYYPINDEKNTRMASEYAKLAAKEKHRTFFLGRLATYRYLDMDDTILEAVELFKTIQKPKAL